MRTVLTLTLLASATVFAQAPTGLAQVFDGQVTTIEREVLGLAQKMPAERYNFAPATGTPPSGTFDGVRTFGLQVRHIATVMYQISSSVLGGEKPPVDIGTTDDGPNSLQTKDQIIQYFQGAIAFSHKAMRSITAENSLQPVPPPFQQPTRAAAAAFIGLHSYDHYGQMVVYARLNGVTPGGGPPVGAGKGKGKAK
ncbi:MAG: DinB family protein [Acidobacteriota bacterium]